MNFFIPILLISISIGAFFTFIDPEYTEIKELKKIKEGFVEQNLKTNKIVKERRELVSEYEKIDAKDRINLNKLLPMHVDNVELIVDIQRIIKENGIGIQISDIFLEQSNITSGNERGEIVFDEEKDYNSIDITFQFTTKYAIFKRFMENIRESLRVLDVVSINMKQELDREEVASDNFSFTIVLRTYWAKK